ncbi:vacuolar protein sorting-associated protein vps17, partial [Aureobasidium sp. EXF-8845]
MDYSSAIANDSGRDPWATSPQHDRSTFNQANNSSHEAPPTNSFHQPPAPDGDDQEHDQNPQLPPQNNQYSSQQPQSQSYDNSVRQEPQRYHHARPQHPPQQYSHNQQPPPQSYQQQQQQQQMQPPQPRKQYKLQAKITALERTGRKDPVLRFDVYTNLPKFRTTQFRDVRRTHSEFVKFADHLISSNPDAFVPAVPPPLTAAGVGTEEDEVRVKASMQRWLNTVCSNNVLMRDEEMVFFVESDFGYSPVVRRKQPATGVRRKYIKQFAPPPDDTPELLEARPIVKSFYLATMDLGQKVDKVVKSRRALGLAESDFGVKMGQMHVQETHTGLANAYKKLGKVIQA